MIKLKKKKPEFTRHKILKNVRIFSDAGGQSETKEPLLKKTTRNNLEKTIRQQTDDLRIRNGQLKDGVDREKIAEEQINIQTKAMESTSDGIFILDAKKRSFPIIYVNHSFEAMTGYVKRELLGQNYFLHYGPSVDPRVVKEIKRVLCEGRFFHAEMLHFRKNGEKYWNLLRITPVRDDSGLVTHYIGIKTDVTLIRQRDLELKEQREEILHVTRVGKLAEFVSSLAHEISQPLTAILSYAQAAQRILAQREPQSQEILQYIINDNLRATEVIRRLRSLLKKGKPVLELLDINTLIDETVVLITTDVTVRNKILRVELGKNLPHVYGDRIQLQQVLLNLISNSLEAMEESKDSHELVISTSRKDLSTILVEVEDSGCGIPVENMKKLFTHFFTSKPDGLGMGLSISRSIVETHGGFLEAKNNPDRGATFYFTIPINIKNG